MAKFKKEYIDRAYKICKEYNAKNYQVAKEFGVSIGTVWYWKKNIPEFSEAIKNGKKEFWII